ncbi:MAG: hypothetical protein ACREBW_05860 [Candidatus Micrarchaeaceae archaeon]
MSQLESLIVFTPDNGRASVTFKQPGTLVSYSLLSGDDLLLTFENPGPDTRVFGEVDGKIKSLLDCTSRFGAAPLPFRARTGVVCFEGAKWIGSLLVPSRAKIYLRYKIGYKLETECPTNELYRVMQEIDKREIHSFSVNPRAATVK